MSQIYRFFCHETPFVLEACAGSIQGAIPEDNPTLVSEGNIHSSEEEIWARIVECLREQTLQSQVRGNRTEQRFKVHRPDVVWEALCGRSLYIEAAGGLVFLNQRMLWIQRHGRWDLPKGKAEPGERPEETALRECAEECGLQGLSLLNADKCYKTYHWYEYKGYPALKCTYWYEMMASPQSGHDLSPQLEEGITSLEWIDYQRMYSEILPDTYPSIRCMVEEIYGSSGGVSAEMPRATTAGTKGAGFPP